MYFLVILFLIVPWFGIDSHEKKPNNQSQVSFGRINKDIDPFASVTITSDRAICVKHGPTGDATLTYFGGVRATLADGSVLTTEKLTLTSDLDKTFTKKIQRIKKSRKIIQKKTFR